MDKQILLYEYEQILLGNKSGFAPYYFKYGNDTSQNYALYIIKFAVEQYLKWSPWDFQAQYNQEISVQLKLEPLMKYIEFPPELDKTKDYYYLAALIYPNIVKVKTKDLVLKTYQEILTGELTKFPKEYLSGTTGTKKSQICLRYMLSQYYDFDSIKEMYKFFAEPSGSRALKQYRLHGICNEIYEHPIDYLHESLPKNLQDEYWYHYFRFKVFYNIQLRQFKKLQKET